MVTKYRKNCQSTAGSAKKLINCSMKKVLNMASQNKQKRISHGQLLIRILAQEEELEKMFSKIKNVLKQEAISINTGTNKSLIKTTPGMIHIY